MNALEFDQKFEEDEDLLACLDMQEAKRPSLDKIHLELDIPAWMVSSIDKEAQILGLTRQDVIKCWLADRLQLNLSAKPAKPVATPADCQQPSQAA